MGDGQVEARHVPSADPAGTAWHVPTEPLTLQEEQTPQLPLVQQTPSTQLLVVHPDAEVQLCPIPIFVQATPMQLNPSAVSQLMFAFPAVQAPAQAPDTHIYPLGHGFGFPGVQVPVPLHFPLPLAVLTASRVSAQPAPGVQAVPFHDSHLPAPSHLPSVPQLVLGVTTHEAWGSTVPEGTLRQLPSGLPETPGILHAVQVPQAVLPQQTPSTQLPLTQAKPLPHAVPFGFSWQVPPTQLFPPFVSVALGARALQSALVVVQLVLQLALLESHWKFPHETAEPGTHVPVPLHVGAGIRARDSETVPPFRVPDTGGAQAAAPQVVPALVSWHPPLPSHLLVLPQGGLAAQVMVSRAEPLAAMFPQVPTLPARPQL
jgi:hypothetical protein